MSYFRRTVRCTPRILAPAGSPAPAASIPEGGSLFDIAAPEPAAPAAKAEPAPEPEAAEPEPEAKEEPAAAAPSSGGGESTSVVMPELGESVTEGTVTVKEKPALEDMVSDAWKWMRRYGGDGARNLRDRRRVDRTA